MDPLETSGNYAGLPDSTKIRLILNRRSSRTRVTLMERGIIVSLSSVFWILGLNFTV